MEIDPLLHAEVRETLRLILESPPFRTSKQCQDLLRYVVLHSLDGEDAALRERIIGIEVFGRKPSYDTNEDPVVRVRAADVRKRMAQYYQSLEPNTPALHIDLLPGSYRAHFRYDPPSPEASAALAVQSPEPLTPDQAPSAPSTRNSRWLLSGIILLVAGVVVAGRSITNPWSSPIERFWEPIAVAKQPALVYLGTNAVYIFNDDYLSRYRAAHGMSDTGPEFFVDLPPGSSVTAEDLIAVKDTFTSTSDSAAAVQVTSLLGSWRRPFVLRAGRDVSFGDLRNRPSVMIGAFNNAWTLELTNDLPYRFRNGVSIENRDHPERSWSVPRNDHDSTTVDYALITRVLTSKAGGPLITVAGVGQAGTQAAAEFLTNPEKMRSLLQNAPRGWESKNMQAVLQVKVVGYLPASVDVVATNYW
jgi:hypothetical protein